MLELQSVVGRQDDWANMVTNVQMVDTPCLAWLPVGKEIVAQERLYQGEVYDDPAENSHPDGKPVTGAKSAGRNRAALKSVIQYSTKAADVSKLTQDFGNQAAPRDELAHDIANQTKEFSKDMEAAILSIQNERIGVTGTVGFKTRGIPRWVQTDATGHVSGYETPTALRPAAAQIGTTATGSLTEDVILNILQGIGTKTRSKETMTCFIGPTGKRAFNNFPMFVPSTASTVNAGAYPRAVRGGAFDRGINRYETDFGPVDLVLSYNNHAIDATTVATYQTHSAYFLHQSKWEVAWGAKPKWMQKPYEGGMYEAFMEAIWMLTCWNPAGEGAWKPAS